MATRSYAAYVYIVVSLFLDSSRPLLEALLGTKESGRIELQHAMVAPFMARTVQVGATRATERRKASHPLCGTTAGLLVQAIQSRGVSLSH